MLVAALMAFGLVLLGASAWAWRSNVRRVTSAPRTWIWGWRLGWVVGAALGVASIFIGYPVAGASPGETYYVHGIPFAAFAFDQGGADYVGALTWPAILLDVVAWALAPQIPLWLALRRTTRLRHSTGSA